MSLLREALVLLIAACVAVPLFKKLKLGAILGYLAAGVLIGPYVLGLVADAEDMLHFSELGIVFFLFLVGLELEPRRLWDLRHSVFGLGAAQLVITAVLVASVMFLLGVPPVSALVGGTGLALSSTAIALQLMAERGQAHTPAGSSGFAMLLFQDLAVIPLLALLPLLSGAGAMSWSDTLLAVLKGALAIVIVILGGRLLVPPLFRAVARARAHEVSVALALFIVVGAGALVTSVGLSMGMGAFLAGVLLADSEYRHELEANVEPFKGLLLGLFFLAIGMTADVRLFASAPMAIVFGVIGLVALKTLVLLVIGRTAGWEIRSRSMVAVSLSQGGEFAFVLFSVAVGADVMGRELANLLVIVVSTSMASTPLLMLVLDRVLARAASGPVRDFDSLEDANHPVIVAGFGRYGQIVARVLTAAGHKFTALEISPEQVDFVRRFGNKIYYGDASRLDLLRAARAHEAKAFVLAIDDVEASVRTATVVKKNFPLLPIYARARNRAHVYKLLDAGVTVLNRETFFSAARLGEEVLVGLGMERDDAHHTVKTFAKADEDLLMRQYAVHHDEQQLMQTSIQARAELQSLFEQDAARRAALKTVVTPTEAANDASAGTETDEAVGSS